MQSRKKSSLGRLFTFTIVQNPLIFNMQDDEALYNHDNHDFMGNNWDVYIQLFSENLL